VKKINTNIKNIRKLTNLSLLDDNHDKLPNGYVRYKKKNLKNLSSNDYLGLSKDKKLIKESIIWTKKYGTSLSSSRLVSGSLDKINEIEKKISKFKIKNQTIIMGSGFQCNSTVIPAILENSLGRRKKSIIFSDKLNHSSIYHGCLLSNQLTKRYNHLDYDHLETLLKNNKNFDTKIIISETVFSMDGDIANIDYLRFLAEKYGCLLYFDEAHASGVFGKNGYGLTPKKSFKNSENEIVVGTFSKAFGSYGSYVSCSKLIRDRIINLCAGLIYSTSLPPSILGSINAAVEIVPKINNVRQKLSRNSKYLKNRLIEKGFNITNSDSQIIPIIFSDNKKCRILANEFRNNGFYLSSILPPTVPIGKSRLRISLTKFITKKDINVFLDILSYLSKKYE
jgi:8-amino-7-oxononanoate synthase